MAPMTPPVFIPTGRSRQEVRASTRHVAEGEEQSVNHGTELNTLRLP